MTEYLLQLADRDLSEIAAASGAWSIRADRRGGYATVRGGLHRGTGGGRVASDDRPGVHGGPSGHVLEVLLRDRVRRPPVEQLIDLVTTGPEVSGVAGRDTSVVVRELFAHAQRSVLVAGYAVYQGQQVFPAWPTACRNCRN